MISPCGKAVLCRRICLIRLQSTALPHGDITFLLLYIIACIEFQYHANIVGYYSVETQKYACHTNAVIRVNMGCKLSFKWNLDDIYVCKEYLLCIDYFIVQSLTTVDVSYFVMNFQSRRMNAFIVNVSLDIGICKQVIRVFCHTYCDLLF